MLSKICLDFPSNISLKLWTHYFIHNPLMLYLRNIEKWNFLTTKKGQNYSPAWYCAKHVTISPRVLANSVDYSIHWKRLTSIFLNHSFLNLTLTTLIYKDAGTSFSQAVFQEHKMTPDWCLEHVPFSYFCFSTISTAVIIYFCQLI